MPSTPASAFIRSMKGISSPPLRSRDKINEHCQIPAGERERFDALPPDFSHLYLAAGGQLAAVICISDTLREEATEVLTALRELGISNTVMLTGDSHRTAKAITADSLWELVELCRIAMALMARIYSNYRFVIGFNGALIVLGVAGVLPPAASAMLHNLSTLGVSLRSMSRLTTQTQSNQGNNLQNG